MKRQRLSETSPTPVRTPNLDRVRRQVMSNQEANEAARYIELLQERVRVLSVYVKEAAGDESCLLPVSTLSRLFYLTDEEREAVLIELHGQQQPGREPCYHAPTAKRHDDLVRSARDRIAGSRA